MDRKSGSYNFGVVCQVGIKVIVVDTFHRNCIIAEKEINVLLKQLFNFLVPLLNNISCKVKGIHMSQYFKACPQTPHHKIKNECILGMPFQ